MAFSLSGDYRQFIEDLKTRILSARISAARAITHEAIVLYRDIGQGIVEKQKVLAWGESVVDKVAAEWRQVVARFTKGQIVPAIWPQVAAKTTTLSIWPQVVAKLDECDTSAFLRQLVAGVPWGHHRLILDKLTEPAARLWYLNATAQMGWSRSVLLNQIKAAAFERAVKEKKAHNFDVALPEHFAEQAEEMLKSTYNLEFLGLRQAVRERELEDRAASRRGPARHLVGTVRGRGPERAPGPRGPRRSLAPGSARSPAPRPPRRPGPAARRGCPTRSAARSSGSGRARARTGRRRRARRPTR